jgi:hypothetical protein
MVVAATTIPTTATVPAGTAHRALELSLRIRVTRHSRRVHPVYSTITALMAA